MGKTGISWTDETWNPTKGCSRTAPTGSNQSGCGDSSGGGCYAEEQAGRIVRMSKGKPCAYDGLVRLTAKGYRWTGKVTLAPDALALPLSWRKPRRIFVNSMSDLFHEALSNEQIAAVFGVMAACPQHTFQVLTKRARRMREWFEWVECESRHRGDWTIPHWQIVEEEAIEIVENLPATAAGRSWPLPNVWLGVSVENQAAADERIPDLLATPAAVRFLSCEPLLGPVTLHEDGLDWLTSEHMRGVDWVIAGCESGKRARECDVDWLRSLRDQCASASVPFFLKQAEESTDLGADGLLEPGDDDSIAFGDGSRLKPRRPSGDHLIELPYLDGVQHAEFPDRRAGASHA